MGQRTITQLLKRSTTEVTIGHLLVHSNVWLKYSLEPNNRHWRDELILESQFESLAGDTLQAVLDGFGNMENSDLLPGLKHRNAHVRLRTLRIMLERDSLDSTMAEQLSEDTDALIRYEAITALLKFGKSFTKEEIKKILVRPQSQHWNPFGK